MTTEERLKIIFSTVMGVSIDRVDANSSPSSVPSWTSLRHMNLISAVEEEFSISLEFDEVMMVTEYELLKQIVCQKAN